MAEQTFSVPNISCGHCVMTIQNELTEMAGVSQVDGDPQAKTITVSFDAPASATQLVEKLKEIGYPSA